jgi:hypothetical protein
MTSNLVRLMRQKHLEQAPDCPYGDQPHYVPPSGEMVGFFLCQPPDDLRNHSRCRPPYDHAHEAHVEWPGLANA